MRNILCASSFSSRLSRDCTNICFSHAGHRNQGMGLCSLWQC